MVPHVNQFKQIQLPVGPFCTVPILFGRYNTLYISLRYNTNKCLREKENSCITFEPRFAQQKKSSTFCRYIKTIRMTISTKART